MAKITITVKSRNFSEVMKNLKLTKEYENNTEFTLDLEIEDCKENFSYLSNSDKVKNWDFIKQIEKLPEEKTSEIVEELEGSVFSILNNPNFKNSSSGLLNLVKLSWDLSKRNLRLVPSVLYPNMINGVIISNLKYKEDDIVKELIKDYYTDVSFSESLEHLISVIKSNWKDLKKSETLNEVITLLFK